jgi:hypothetical protein
MGSTYLIGMADVLRDAGLNVVEVDGWQHRARGSGGFDSGRPWCVMWHHTASDTTPENDVNYIVDGSPDAPIANLYLARDGTVWVCAGGASNTNGKGGPVAVSRGTIPVDSMNTYAIGVEIANNGVGEPWPQVQVDAAFAVSLALTAGLDLASTDALGHVDWSPGRKIDPATADAVQGPWKPRSINTSGSWNVDDTHTELVRRDGHTPTPTPGSDDMQIRLLTLTDSDAQFLAQTDDQGQALYVTWAGPGGPGSNAERAIAAHRSEAARKGHVFEQEGNLAGLFNCVRVGRLPVGDRFHEWTGAEFWTEDQ